MITAQLGQLVTRTTIIDEVKSDIAWQFYQQSGTSDFRKRLEKGLSQARLIIVDPTVVKSAMVDCIAALTALEHQITTYNVLWQMLANHSPLHDLVTKDVMLPDGIVGMTENIGRIDKFARAFDPHYILMKVGRRYKRPGNLRISVEKVLLFTSQLTSAYIDVVNPEIWHAESEQSDTTNRAEDYYRYTKINIYNLSKSCDRGKWFDDDTPQELHELAEAVLHDANTVNRLFNPHAGVAKNLIGNFTDYQVIAKDGPWKYASNIAAGFAKKWFEDHPAPIQF